MRCPACESIRVVIVLGPRRHRFCASCGWPWEQAGHQQAGAQTGDHLPEGDSPGDPIPA